MKDNIKKLLDEGINTQDKNGATPLMLATWSGDLAIVEKLIKDGADVSLVDNLGSNVVHYATRQKSIAVLLAILNTSADKNLKCNKSGYCQTPIFTPAEVGNIPILRTLLENGVNPNVYDSGKFTPLQWATQQGKLESIRVLLEFGADVNTKSKKWVTPLMSSVISGVLDSVMLLVEAGAELNATSKTGYTALIFAAYYGYTEIAEYLLEKVADNSYMSSKGETALMIAEKKKHHAIVALPFK